MIARRATTVPPRGAGPVAGIAVTLLLLLGCDAPSSKPVLSTPADTPAPIRVLVVDDAEWAHVLREQWQLLAADEQLDVRTTTARELTKARRLSADVVIFPARELGSLAERGLLQPLPEAMLQRPESAAEGEPQLAIDDLLPTVRQCDISWGRKAYAVTLGSPQLVLLYRPDLFAKLKLKVPTTWDEYQTAAEKLSDRSALGDLAPADDQPWHAALEPTADGWAGATLLARAAASVRSEAQLFTWFNLDDMAPRVASPPMVQAAQQMAQAAKLSGVEPTARRTPAEVRQAFFAGHAGMALTWPAGAETASLKVPIAFAELPGSRKFYSYQEERWIDKTADADLRVPLCAVAGRLASVTKEARRSRSAFQFLAWLQSDDAAEVLGPASNATTLFTQTQLANPQPWLGSSVPPEAATQYATVVRATFSRPIWTPALRLPGAAEYHAALDSAVQATLADPAQAEASLQAAAKRWEEITRQFNLADHRRAFQRALGSDL